MSVAAADPSSVARTGAAVPLCSAESLATLKGAFAAFVRDPLPAAWNSLQRAVENLAPADPRFAADLAAVREQQFQKHGGFTQRYVLSKDVGPDGALRPLPRAIPVRDDTRTKLVRLVRDNPASFPGGIQQLLNTDRPLQQASSANFAKLIAATVHCEVDSLLRCDRNKLLKSAATLLDLAETYRHLQRLAGAAPKVVETIDRGDTTAMIEFLVTLGTRTPLTVDELTRFVSQAAAGWQQATDKDLIIRGRVLQTGLDAKAPLLKTWVEPFASEVVFRQLQADLQAAFRKRLADTAVAAPPTPPPAPRPSIAGTTGTFSAPFKPASATSRSPATTPPAAVTETASVDLSGTDAFKIPIGVPEPPRLQVLRNYLNVASAATVIRLSEAMRMSEARDDVAGHRQYVQRAFRDAGWAVIGQTRGDPMFSRLSSVTAGGAPPA